MIKKKTQNVEINVSGNNNSGRSADEMAHKKLRNLGPVYKQVG